MTEKVNIEFTLLDGKREKFFQQLQEWDEIATNCCVGFRADDQVQRREALVKFVDAMELKLRKNDYKNNWRTQPVEALFRLMILEIEEFKVAHEFFPISAARPELVDIANFALILWDRLGMLDAEQIFRETGEK